MGRGLPPPLGQSIYIHYVEHVCTGSLSLLPLIDWLTIFMSVWTGGSLFYPLGHNPIPLYLVTLIVPALALEALLVGICVPLTPCYQLRGFVCFWALPYFLALQAASGSSYIFLVLVLESAISLRNLISFYWKMVLEMKTWVQGAEPAFYLTSHLKIISNYRKVQYSTENSHSLSRWLSC